jgi:hypothetical protein
MSCRNEDLMIKRFLFLLPLVMLPLSAPLPAQTDSRGTVPPGSAADGSRPADGAIQGGSILPGERGGVPEGSGRTPEQRIAKCNELSGVLRDQCLRDAKDASVGGSRDPAIKEPAPSVPPPQNPR